jgi:hypothetical protein
VFENFGEKKACQATYKLDPLNYITAASLAWDAMMLKTNIELGLISDIKIMDIMERGTRGGLTFVGSQIYAKANNKYLPDYDETTESTYILYPDANNLYGHSMSEPLPYGDLKIYTKITIEEVLETVDDADIGYTVEVDISFPEKIHGSLNQYIPLPENIIPNTEWFSDYQKDVMKKTNRNSKCIKLVNHFSNIIIMFYITAC